MERGRILIVGQKKDSAYAIRNVFDLERYEIEVVLLQDVAKSVLKERVIDLIILDPALCLEEHFDLIEFQLDHGLETPMVVVGGNAVELTQAMKFEESIKVHFIPADGFKLLEFVKALGVPERVD